MKYTITRFEKSIRDCCDFIIVKSVEMSDNKKKALDSFGITNEGYNLIKKKLYSSQRNANRCKRKKETILV